jgi:hypothetical protein
MSQSNPDDTDAILGGQDSLPFNAAILGGLDGVKKQLANESIMGRIRTLNNSIQYGSKAIDIARQSLTDESEEVQKIAKRLLRDHCEETGKELLLDHDPMSYFTTFNDWKHTVYNHKVGIVDPKNNALIIEISRDLQKNINDISQLENLIEEPNILELQALIIKAAYSYTPFYYSCSSYKRYIKNMDMEGFAKGYAISNICDFFQKHQYLFCNLKALYIGEPAVHNIIDINSALQIDDLTQLLYALPNIEILHIRGDFRNANVNGYGFKHQKLKSLVIDAIDPRSAVCSLYPMNTPNLEYFELLMHDTLDTQLYSDSIIESMSPILVDRVLPKLKYLGLSNINGNQKTSRMIELLMKTTIIEQLAVIDLKLSRITSDQAAYILRSPRCKNLRILNISSDGFPEALYGYTRKVESLPIDYNYDDEDYSVP